MSRRSVTAPPWCRTLARLGDYDFNLALCVDATSTKRYGKAPNWWCFRNAWILATCSTRRRTVRRWLSRSPGGHFVDGLADLARHYRIYIASGITERAAQAWRNLQQRHFDFN